MTPVEEITNTYVDDQIGTTLQVTVNNTVHRTISF